MCTIFFLHEEACLGLIFVPCELREDLMSDLRDINKEINLWFWATSVNLQFEFSVSFLKIWWVFSKSHARGHACPRVPKFYLRFTIYSKFLLFLVNWGSMRAHACFSFFKLTIYSKFMQIYDLFMQIYG